MHVIDQSIEHIAQLLKEKVDAVVYFDTDEKAESLRLPAIRVSYEGDEPNDEESFLGHECRDIDIDITIITRDSDRGIARQQAMSIRAEVEGLLSEHSFTFGSVNTRCDLGRVISSVSIEGEKYTAEQTMAYVYTLFYKHGDVNNFA